MIFTTYTERMRLANLGGAPEVYTYDEAPPQFRHQICLAFTDGLGPYRTEALYNSGLSRESIKVNECWGRINHICYKEIFPYRTYANADNPFEGVINSLISIGDMNSFLSIVEVGCIFVSNMAKDIYLHSTKQEALLGAVAEINGRFEQHAIGYQFENGKIIRNDSKFIHAQIIKPALSLLSTANFEKINDEFMTAHEHYRHRKFKDSVTAANRAYETMLKVICDLNKWKYSKGDRATELITVVSQSGLFTRDFDKGFMAYIAAMKTGLPSVRNDAGGHGDGLADKEVTAEIARYAIDLAASNILFLGNCHLALKRRKGA
jgi:hypothetical protein